LGAIDQLAGQAQLLRGDLRAVSFSCGAQAFLGPQHEEIEDRARRPWCRRPASCRNGRARRLDQPGGLGRGEAVLGLAHEFRLRMKQETSAQPPARQVVAGDVAAFLLPTSSP
jgi:hypothetical protein